jgi:hypothetical protein
LEERIGDIQNYHSFKMALQNFKTVITQRYKLLGEMAARLPLYKGKILRHDSQYISLA